MKSSRGPAHQARIAAAIHRAVSLSLARGLHDKRIKGLVSVTGVQVAPDLRQATVDVSVLPAEYETTTLRGLQHAAPRVQAELGRVVRLRRVPRLVFRIDRSLKRAAELDRALAETKDHPDETSGEPA